MPLSRTWEDGLKAFAKKEYAAAAKLFRPLAEKGNAVAQYRIALMHKMGLGVSKDRKQAQKWSRLAAKQGNTDAQVLLGSLYYKGEGGENDDIARAYMWYDVAATKGNEEAKKELAAISTQLTSQQITEAREKAQKCTASSYELCD
ncbi:MAG: tetratricopeptide repeat protein [Afipia sp.]